MNSRPANPLSIVVSGATMALAVWPKVAEVAGTEEHTLFMFCFSPAAHRGACQPLQQPQPGSSWPAVADVHTQVARMQSVPTLVSKMRVLPAAWLSVDLGTRRSLVPFLVRPHAQLNPQ